MNREIKFRGKVKGTSKNPDGLWVYGFAYKDEDNNWFILYDFPSGFGNGRMKVNAVITETVSQFTGLKDKNLVDIYKGDILKTKLEINVFVEYSEEYAEFMFIDSDDMRWTKGEDYNREVIGNIFDNPELKN